MGLVLEGFPKGKMPQNTVPGPDGEKGDFASQIRAAETVISRRHDAELSKGEPRRSPVSLKVPVYLVVIFISAIVVYLNFPELTAATMMKKPLRTGSYLTDRKTDLCISNLWAITSALRANLPAPKLLCPLSDEPYEVTPDSAACPNPGLHYAAAIHGNKVNVIPTLEK